MASLRKRASIQRNDSKTDLLSTIGNILIVTAAIAFLIGITASRSPLVVREGMTLNHFTLDDIQGKSIRLEDYAGKTVLINVWATWCPPCKAEMPELNAFYRSHQADGLAVLAINSGEPASVVETFARQRGLNFPVLLDPNNSVISRLGIRSFPTRY
jgi:peroxiredoxin